MSAPEKGGNGSREAAPPKGPSSLWEAALWHVSRDPRPHKSRPPLTLVIPASAQVPTPNREFLLRTPSEGVSYVATVAENLGWDVEIVDMRLGVSSEDAAARAASRGGVLAMPTFADSFPHNRRVLDLVRTAAPKIPRIIGGTLVSSLPAPVLEALPADHAILGEGELGFFELLEHIDRGGTKAEASRIQGLAIRHEQPGGRARVEITTPRAQMNDLDAVPIPNLFLYPSVREDPRIPELGLTTARGCYASCTFCFVNFKKLRFKSPARVREEIRDIKAKHAVEYVYINDLTFTADVARARQIAEVLGEAGVTWSCSTRVEKAPRDLLEHMRACGCRDIWYGVESVDQSVLDLANKRQTVEQIFEAIRETQAAGIKVVTNFIIGLPGETRESLDAMIRFVEDEVVTPASVKYLSPFPGTAVFDDALRRGVIGDPIEYLEALARRRVNDAEDEIYNMTDLPDSALRDAFQRLDALRRSRVEEHFRATARPTARCSGPEPPAGPHPAPSSETVRRPSSPP